MADTLETGTSASNDAKISEISAASAAPTVEEAPTLETLEENYPPLREVILIMSALATAIFLVSLVSHSWPALGMNFILTKDI
jgi:hypothetical protein